MVDIHSVKDFYDFYKRNKTFVDNTFSKASGGKTLNIDEDLYQLSIEEGSVTLFEIFDEEAESIGYVSLVLTPDMLNKGNVVAVVDHIALVEEARGNGVSTYVIKRIEEFLKDNDINELNLVFPPTEEHDCVASKLGFKKSTVFHKKELGEL